jgi:hypothetical protein
LDREHNFEYGEFTLINRIPAMAELANKNMTFKILNDLRRKYESQFNFYSKTFILPEEWREYKDWHSKNKNEPLISKLGGGCHGFGCKIIRKYKEPKDFSLDEGPKDKSERVIQSYIHSPLLLKNKKWDLRVYVAIVSYDPLVAFVNKEGLARFCTEDYISPLDGGKKIDEHGQFSNYT